MQGRKYSAINEKNSADREAFNNMALSIFFKGMLMASAILLLCNKLIVRFLYADAYYDSWQATSFLLVGNLFLSTATFFGTSYYVEKKMLGNFLSAVIGAVVNIVLNAVLIPGFGAAGATMAAAVSYIVIMIYRYFDTRKYLKLDFWIPENVISMALLLGLLFLSDFQQTFLSVIVFGVLLLVNVKYIVKMLNMGMRVLKSICLKER